MNKSLISPQIDYLNHPGFHGLSPTKIDKFADVGGLFDQTEREFLEISKLPYLNKKEFKNEFVKRIHPLHLEMKKYVDSYMEESAAFKPIVSRALDDFLSQLEIELKFIHGKKKRLSENESQKKLEVLKQGYTLFQADQKIIQSLWDSIPDWRAKLREKMLQKPQNMASCVVSLPKEGKPWKLINLALDQLNVFDLVDDLSLNPMDFDYYALHLAHPHESWWKNCYADVGLPTSDTAYMHYDEDSNLIKMMIYLQPVDATNSPFCVTPSDKVNVLPFVKELFFKRLDVHSRSLISEQEWAKNYYRPIFSNPKHRREFLKIPVAMQGTSHFGDDVINGSELSRCLLGNEVKLLSSNANAALFMGGTVIHRGGMVEKGERWALQLGFRPRDLSLGGRVKRAKDRIKQIIPREVRMKMRGKLD